MRKYSFILSSILLLASATGCNTEISIGTKNGPELVFTTDTPFEDGMQAGIFIDRPMLYRNVKSSYSAGKLLTENKLYWLKEMPQDTVLSFRAYSPYNTAFNVAGVVPFSVAIDQSKDEEFAASDLMMAKTEASPADKSINFSFEHKLSKLTIYLKSEEQIEEVTLSGVMPSVYLNFERDLFRPSGDRLELKGHLSGKDKDGVSAYEFILIPQSASLQLSAKAGSHSCTVVSTASVDLEGGKQYTHERLIDLDADRRSPYPFSLLPGDWEEPSFSYEEPLPEGLELLSATQPGIYSYDNGIVKEILLSDDPGCQGALLYSNKLNAYRVMNPAQGQYFSISIPSGALKQGSTYTATLNSLSIKGIPESLSSTVKVEKKEGKTAWIVDESNGLAYVISTNK